MMPDADQRLRRLVIAELGECQEGDVQQRRADLETLADTVFTEDPAGPLFRILGDETRYRLARILAAGDERCVCELEPLVEVSESAVSHALSDLVDTGLADRRKEGNWRYYESTARAEELFATADTVAASGKCEAGE